MLVQWVRQVARAMRGSGGDRGAFKRGRWHGSGGIDDVYSEVLLLLGGAVVAAPLFKRIGLGTVLGYLAAGIAIGPAARLITGGEEILHVAELGIVFLLFIIGLEIKPSRLWSLRREIFGLGLAQVVVTGVAAAGLALPAGRARLAGRDHRRLRPGAVVHGIRHADPRAGRHDTNTKLRPDGLLDPAVPGFRHRAAAGADPAAGTGSAEAPPPGWQQFVHRRSARLPRC